MRPKLHGVVLTISGVSGNAATRLESIVTKNGRSPTARYQRWTTSFAVRLANSTARSEALLHQLQSILRDEVVQAPINHLGFPIGVGRRVEDIMATAIPGFYMSPYEGLKLRRP